MPKVARALGLLAVPEPVQSNISQFNLKTAVIHPPRERRRRGRQDSLARNSLADIAHQNPPAVNFRQLFLSTSHISDGRLDIGDHRSNKTHFCMHGREV